MDSTSSTIYQYNKNIEIQDITKNINISNSKKFLLELISFAKNKKDLYRFNIYSKENYEQNIPSIRVSRKDILLKEISNGYFLNIDSSDNLSNINKYIDSPISLKQLTDEMFYKVYHVNLSNPLDLCLKIIIDIKPLPTILFGLKFNVYGQFFFCDPFKIEEYKNLNLSDNLKNILGFKLSIVTMIYYIENKSNNKNLSNLKNKISNLNVLNIEYVNEIMKSKWN